MQSLEMVFEYFFAVGTGLGVGLSLTIGTTILIYKVVENKWLKGKK